MIDEERQLWRVGEIACVMISCCTGAELQLRRVQSGGTAVGDGEIVLRELYPTKSDLYELPAGATRKKNTHGWALHIDLDHDVRSLMSVKPDFYWFTTTHHELGHIYYYLAYARPEVPVVLRDGANRAFHEGIGVGCELHSMQIKRNSCSRSPTPFIRGAVSGLN